MKKKATALVLSAAMLLSLAACGSKAAESVPEATPTAATGETATEETAPQATYIQPAAEFAGGSGTEEDPFQIATAEQLALLAEMCNRSPYSVDYKEDDLYRKGYYILTADIALNDTSDFANWQTKAPTYSWKPIAARMSDDASGSRTFYGHFDGQNHTISGLYCYQVRPAETNGDEIAGGLFEKISQSSIKNLNITDSMVTVKGRLVSTGVLAADSYDSTFENCNVDAVLVGDDMGDVGGLVGDAYKGAIQGCTFSGKITADSVRTIGGISGMLSSSDIENCVNSGKITIGETTAADCGGVVGDLSNSTAQDCYNQGDVIAAGTISSAGGICGQLSVSFEWGDSKGTRTETYEGNAKLLRCGNEGTVTAPQADYTGGIIGHVFSSDSRAGTAEIQDCSNKGLVEGADYTGGVIGDLASGFMQYTLSDCTNLGAVQGDTWVGGVVGIVHSCVDNCVIENCINQGNVEASGHAGGIIGSSFMIDSAPGDENYGTLHVKECKNSGNVTVESMCAGGIIGTFMLRDEKNQTLEITRCENTGTIHSTDMGRLGGILGGSYFGYVDTRVKDVGCIIQHCVNSGILSYCDAAVDVASLVQPAESQDTPEEERLTLEGKAWEAGGGRAVGGIVGTSSRTVVEKCLNSGHILLASGDTAIGNYEAFSSATEDTATVFVGGIYGMLLYGMDDENDTIEREHISDCAYVDNAPGAAYAPFLPEDSGVITNTRQITAQEAEQMAAEILA